MTKGLNEISFSLLVIAHYVYRFYLTLLVFLYGFHHVRPDDGLIVKGRNMQSPLDTLHHNKVLCFDVPTRYLFDI